MPTVFPNDARPVQEAGGGLNSLRAPPAAAGQNKNMFFLHHKKTKLYGLLARIPYNFSHCRHGNCAEPLKTARDVLKVRGPLLCVVWTCNMMLQHLRTFAQELGHPVRPAALANDPADCNSGSEVDIKVRTAR